MPRGFPSFNPFPAQATTAIEEGSFAETYADWVASTPTIQLSHVEQLTSLSRRFLDAVHDTEKPTGLAAFVHGEHGSGKTHAMRAAVGGMVAEAGVPSPVPVYAKLGSADFGEAYRALMSQISLAQMKDIALAFLGSLRHPSAIPVGHGPELLSDPTILLKLFQEHLVERGPLLEEQAHRLQRVVEDTSDFQRALTYLMEPDLQDFAFSWLRGREVPEPELRRLGISKPLNTAIRCRSGLQLMTLLCARARRPLIVMLDQAERFLLDGSGAIIVENASVVHSLVEAIPDIGGMLVVAASEKAWVSLPDDVRQRFGANHVGCEPLQPQFAAELLGAYIATALGPSDEPYEAPWPFSDAAVERLLRNSGGNLRAILQLAGQAFDSRELGKVVLDAEDIPAGLLRIDRDAVGNEIEKTLRWLGSRASASVAGFQYAVELRTGDRLLVRLTEAMLYVAEAERAKDDIQARLNAEPRTDGSAVVPERYVLVVIGYASKDVLDLLRSVYDAVIVCRSLYMLSFELQIAAESSRGPALPVARADLYDRLSAAGSARNDFRFDLGDAIDDVGRRHLTEASQRRFASLMQRWPEERDRLREKIQDLRRGRLADELDEFRRADLAFRGRERGLSAVNLLLLLPGAFAFWALYALRQQFVTYLAIAVYLLLVILVLRATVSRLRVLRVPAPSSLSQVEGEARERVTKEMPLDPAVGIVAALRDAVAALSGRRRWTDRETYRRSSRIREAMRSRDPYVRYGNVLGRLDGVDRPFLRAAMLAESVSIVRRALAVRLGRRSLDEPWQQAVGESADRLPEFPYVVQYREAPYWREIEGLEPQVRLVIALANQNLRGVLPGEERNRSDGYAATPPQRQAREEEGDPAVLRVLSTRAGNGQVGQAYKHGIDHLSFVAISRQIDDPELERIERLLSPIAGLGSFDHLEDRDEIESLYLFFRQLLFLREGSSAW